jgi:hypothetical protein
MPISFNGTKGWLTARKKLQPDRITALPPDPILRRLRACLATWRDERATYKPEGDEDFSTATQPGGDGTKGARIE